MIPGRRTQSRQAQEGRTRVFAAIAGQAAVGRPATLRLGPVRAQLEDPAIRPGVAALLRDALARLRRAFPTQDVGASVLSEITDAFGHIILWEAWQVHRAQAESHPERYGPETLRLLRTASTVSEDAYQAALRRRDDLLPRAAEVYRDVDVLITPAAPFAGPVTTPPVDTPEGELEGMLTGNTAHTQIDGRASQALRHFTKYQSSGALLSVGLCGRTPLRLLATCAAVDCRLIISSWTHVTPLS